MEEENEGQELNESRVAKFEPLPFINPYAVKKRGRPLNFTPEQLAYKFAEFVEWCKQHPLPVGEVTTSQKGDKFFKEKNAPRMVSIGAFIVFLGETRSWWDMLGTRDAGEEFVRVKTRIREFCENYQIEMASTGFFKENIISRLLGLADKTNNKVEVDVESERPVIKIG